MVEKITTWNIEFDEYYLPDLHKYFYITTTQHFLNIKKEYMSIIEKTVYDIAKFHSTRFGIKNIENDEYRISFWLKNKSASCLKCVYLHTDIDDYEQCIYKNWSIKPIFTSLTYLNENENPTIITNVSKKESQRNYYPNKNIALVFPKKNLNVCFESGKYMHGECNLFGNAETSERLVLVVAIWKELFPINVPFYDEILYNYIDYMKNAKPIKHNYMKKDFPFVKLTSKNRKYILQSPFINDTFFRLLFSDDDNAFKEISNIINKEIIPFTDIMHIEPFATQPQQDQIENDYKTTEIDISELKNYMRSSLNITTFNVSNNLVKEHYIDTLLKECMNADIHKTAYLLDLNKTHFNFVEKFVYDLAKHDFATSGNILDSNIKVEYWFKANKTYTHNNMHLDSNEVSMKTVGLTRHPFLTSITYLNTNLNPTIITNIDESRYKYKKIDNMNLFFSFPSSFKKIQLEGGKYFHTECSIYGNSNESRNVLVINYWRETHPPDLIYHSFNEIPSTLYDKDIPILNFTDTSKITKIDLNKNNSIVDYNFFQTCLYSKNDNNIFNNFADLFRYKNLEENTNFLVYVVDEDTNKEYITSKSNISPLDFFSKTLQSHVFSNKKILPITANKDILDNIVKIYLENRNVNNEINISDIPELEQNVIPLLGIILNKATTYYNLDNMNINIDKITVFDSTEINELNDFTKQSFMALLLLDNESSVIFDNKDIYDMVAGNLIYFDSKSSLITKKGYFFLMFYFSIV